MKIGLQIIAVGIISAGPLLAADEFRYVKATVENTTLADGTPLKIVSKSGSDPAEITRSPEPAEPDNHWHWWEGQGTGTGAQRGLFTAAGKTGNNAPPLRTTVTGLKPKSNYRVHGFFWIDAAAGSSKPNGDQSWDIRLGLALADMKGYGYATGSGLPDTIGLTKDSDALVKQPDAPMLTDSGQPAPDTDGSRCMFRVALGVARTDDHGTLIVYADDQSHDTNQARTCYDGIGLTEGPAARADAGAGSPVALSRAVRSGDWEMMRRELAAGADPNIIDAESRTPLFYVCAVGDYDHAAALLKAGAKPDVAGQQMSPLWAAGTLGDAKLTKLLLDAGAVVTDDNMEQHTAVSALRSNDHVRYNPIAAAFGSGSVDTLHLLLDNNPGLDLEKAVFGADFKSGEGLGELVSNAIASGCPAMAAFLINKGYRIKVSEVMNLPTPDGGGYARTGSASLMLRAVMNQPPMMEVIEALNKRGVPLVMMDKLEYESVVVPWDALSAAVWDGNALLTKRWLPLAKDAPEDYRILLTTLADASYNDDVAELVHRQYPEVKRAPYPHAHDPVERGREQVAGKPGVFTPRALAPTSHKDTPDTITLAVISASGAEGQGESLAANASNDKVWTVVERGIIDKLIAEKSFDRASSMGTIELSAIGDGLAADIIVTVAKLKTGEVTVLRFEAANVRTGLPIDRVFIEANGFKPESFTADYLGRIRSKFTAQSGAGRLTGITLLGVTPERGLTQGATLGNLVHAGLLQAIDDTPGLITLTRDQMKPVAEEKVLKDSGALWGAGWTLEGGLRKGAGDKVVLALRLSRVGESGARHEVTAEGVPDQLQTLVEDAWKKIAGLLDKQLHAIADPAQRAAAEAARLLREAEWIANGPRNWEAAPLADAAVFLGADPMKALRLRMRCHWNMRHVWNPRAQWGSTYQEALAGGYPLRPEFHDYTRRWVREYLELLTLTAETLDRVGNIYRSSPSQAQQDSLEDFCNYLDELTLFRCRIIPKYLDADQRATLVEYDNKLSALWARLLPWIPYHNSQSVRVSEGGWFGHYERLTQHFRPIPWLGEMIAAYILSHPTSPGVYRDELLVGTESLELRNFDNPRPEIMATMLECALKNSDSPNQDLRMAEIDMLRAPANRRVSVAKVIADAWIEVLAKSPPPPTPLVSVKRLRRWLPMHNSCSWIGATTTTSRDIPTLVAAPRHSPDMLFRLSAYDMGRYRFGFAIDRNSKLWRGTAQCIISDLNFRLGELVRMKAAPQAFDALLERVAEIDATYQAEIFAIIEPKIKTLLPEKPQKSFGSKGQFRTIDFDGALEGKLLADVRNGVTRQPGLITSVTVDPSDTNLIWMAIHPQNTPNQQIHYSDPTKLERRAVACKQPWLVAIDCRDGHLVRKVNLAEAAFPGEVAAKDSELGQIGGFLRAKPVFGDVNTLLLVLWNQLERIVVLNRRTGETSWLPKPRQVVVFDQLDGGNSPAMGGIGDAFYLLEETRYGKPDVRNICDRIIWQIVPGKEPRQLNHPGRVPPDSPFDTEDHKPRLLRVDGGKLLIGSSWSWDHFAHFDPATDKWAETPERTEAEWHQHVNRINKELRDSIRCASHYQFVNDERQVDSFGGPDVSKPGYLVFTASGREAKLPVSLAVPPSYQGTFMLSAAIPNTDPPEEATPEQVTVADLESSDMVCPVILNQTTNHFVLGLRLKALGGFLSDYEPTYLPFLWIIDKKTMRAGMNAQLR